MPGDVLPDAEPVKRIGEQAVGLSIGMQSERRGEGDCLPVEDRGNGNADLGMCLPHLMDEPVPSVDTPEVTGRDLLQIRET